jgi:ribonuclease HII
MVKNKGKLVLGVDEAGRGPVIGSLFIAGALFDEKDVPKLKKLGVKDSKLLLHKKRIELEVQIKRLAKKYKIIKVSPQEIDHAVDGGTGLNLNWLEAHKTAQIINELNPDKVILDCPSPNIGKYTEYVRKLLKNKDVELVVEHKADLNHIECSSASVLAKCSREEEVEQLKRKYGNIGPGYTSNEVTQRFIKENYDKYPEIFRKSWSTWKNQNNNQTQKKLDEF